MYPGPGVCRVGRELGGRFLVEGVVCAKVLWCKGALSICTEASEALYKGHCTEATAGHCRL